MASFESLQGSYWPLSNKRFTVTVGCTWCFPLSRPIGARQGLKTSHAWLFKHRVWVRKVKIKKYWKIPEIYPVKRYKKRKVWKNEINRWTRCGKMILKNGKFSSMNDLSFCHICCDSNTYSLWWNGLEESGATLNRANTYFNSSARTAGDTRKRIRFLKSA